MLRCCHPDRRTASIMVEADSLGRVAVRSRLLSSLVRGGKDGIRTHGCLATSTVSRSPTFVRRRSRMLNPDRLVRADLRESHATGGGFRIRSSRPPKCGRSGVETGFYGRFVNSTGRSVVRVAV